MKKIELLLAPCCSYAQPLIKGCVAREPLVYLCRTRSSRVRGLERPFNEMMPRGPGILSVRDA